MYKRSLLCPTTSQQPNLLYFLNSSVQVQDKISDVIAVTADGMCSDLSFFKTYFPLMFPQNPAFHVHLFWNAVSDGWMQMLPLRLLALLWCFTFPSLMPEICGETCTKCLEHYQRKYLSLNPKVSLKKWPCISSGDTCEMLQNNIFQVIIEHKSRLSLDRIIDRKDNTWT